jgi:hypothetical protein
MPVSTHGRGSLLRSLAAAFPLEGCDHAGSIEVHGRTQVRPARAAKSY